MVFKKNIIFVLVGLYLVIGALGTFSTTSTTLTNDSFDERDFNCAWSSMQKKYGDLSRELDCKGLRELEKLYYHSYWVAQRIGIQRLLQGPPNRDFLSLSEITGNMVVEGWTQVQDYEVKFLKDYTSRKVASLVEGYHEPIIGPRNRECQERHCSSNALHLLCYAAKILDLCESPETIVEFGSGYGCLAHIFKQIVPDCTLILIDLPELLAIQYLYLRAALPQAIIQLHTHVNENFEKGAIHLVPVHFLKDLNVTADVFVSTFALSESPKHAQKIVCDKKFFDANMVYITGQLYGWKNMFEDHFLLYETARSIYASILCIPYYYTLFTNLQSYELVAFNNR